MEETMVLIVGAGPAGLATSACLNRLQIPNIVIEREDCCASLWKKRAYDRLKLHLAKQFCALPYMPYPSDAPTFVPRIEFINYIDNYVSSFNINPRYNRLVESAIFDEVKGRWQMEVKNTSSNVNEVYAGKFLVVATGENSEGLIPKVRGLDSFEGEYMHSNKYENGRKFNGKNVLVVGCGNSGMEIAYDLWQWGATTHIVARSPMHVFTKDMIFLGMVLLKFLPYKIVDYILVMLSKLRYGNISRYGLRMPKEGPFYLKETTGRTPTIDVGAVEKIKTGQIQVLPSIASIQGDKVKFENGNLNHYDAIIFATGYKSTVRNWLKDGKGLFNEAGMPTPRFPDHWKGENGLYCAGFSVKGLLGIANDARNIASDINSVIDQELLN